MKDVDDRDADWGPVCPKCGENKNLSCYYEEDPEAGQFTVYECRSCGYEARNTEPN